MIASSSGGDYRQVPLGTLSGGQTAQATFSYSSAGFVGSIWTQGTADQGLFFSNYLMYPTANQPPTPGAPGSCSAEGGIADAQPYPAVAGGGSVIVKTQAGCYNDVFLPQPQFTGLTGLDYGGGAGVGSRTATFFLDANIHPDVSTPDRSWYLQVSTKDSINTTHIPVTQAGLTCNFQPVASLLTVPASGYLGTITMSVEPNCMWSQYLTDFPTIVHFVQGPPPYMTPPPVHTGPGSIQYLIDATNSPTDYIHHARWRQVFTGVSGHVAPLPHLVRSLTSLHLMALASMTCKWQLVAISAPYPGHDRQDRALRNNGCGDHRSGCPADKRMLWTIPANTPAANNYWVRITPYHPLGQGRRKREPHVK
jgi:hypothetical protein